MAEVAAESRGLEAHGNDIAGSVKAQGPESQASEGQSESDRSDLRPIGLIRLMTAPPASAAATSGA
jgi:hypothetical protein